MKRAAGFQVDFWTAFTDAVIDLDGTAEHLFGASQDQLKAAARAAAQTLIPASVPTQAGTVIGQLKLSVDHTRTVEQLVAVGNYNGYINPNITSQNFPHQREGIEAVTLKLVKFERVMTTRELERELPQFGDPSDMDDMLTTGKDHPRQQRQNPIVFLGASWVDPDGHRRVGYLRGDAGFRGCHLPLTDPDDRWGPRCVFAVRAR